MSSTQAGGPQHFLRLAKSARCLSHQLSLYSELFVCRSTSASSIASGFLGSCTDADPGNSLPLTYKGLSTCLFFNLTIVNREPALCPDVGAFHLFPLKQNLFGTLKRVSGNLKKLWLAQAQRSLNEVPMVRLLVVDNEETICFSMSEYFSLHGYKVDTARDIEEADKLLRSFEYKVVIQDLRLGSTNNSEGLEMIRTIRKQHPPTRIIVLTAYASAEIEDEARRCGADAFLRKPKPLPEVAQLVQSLIESPPKQGHPVLLTSLQRKAKTRRDI